ncbi:Ribonuclease H, partial [Abortiporus biennis]
MPKVKTGYYAVARGRNIGVYETWAECEAETRGFTGAKYKKFYDKDEAYAWATGSASVANNRTTPSTAFPARVNSASATSERPGWDVVYSDGACKGNGKTGSVAGIGVWWSDQDPRNIKERCPGAQTNNRAELIAIARVLETAPKITKPLLIKTDSQYSMNCFKQWIHNWKNKNWKNSKGEAVKNAELIRYIDALLGERAMGRQKVEMEYVQGHVGIPGNEGADGLANEGCLYPEEPDRDWVALEAEVFRRIESFGLANKNTSAVAQGANSAGSSHVDN